MVLSARLQAVADMVSKGFRACDVGCDHGYISIYLAEQGISPSGLAMDVKEGPLGRAKEHILQAGLEEYIRLRLSDGLSAYQKGEADCLICAGMGGRLMRRILEADPAKTRDFQEMVLQPQSEIAPFRKFLREEGYLILRENMVYEEGKFYPVIKATAKAASREGQKSQPGQEPALADRFGPLLLGERHPVLLEYIKREWENSGKIKSALMASGSGERVLSRLRELEEEMADLKAAAGIYGYSPKTPKEELHDND